MPVFKIFRIWKLNGKIIVIGAAQIAEIYIVMVSGSILAPVRTMLGRNGLHILQIKGNGVSAAAGNGFNVDSFWIHSPYRQKLSYPARMLHPTHIRIVR